MGLRVIEAGVPRVRAQVVTQAVRNVGQVAQGQRVGRVCACYGYFQGVDSVDAPSAACGGPGARVDDHPRRGRGRVTAPPRFTWRIIEALGRVAVKDDRRVDVRRL